MMRLRSDGRMTKGSEDHPKKGRDAEDGYNARAAFPQQGGYNFFVILQGKHTRQPFTY